MDSAALIIAGGRARSRDPEDGLRGSWPEFLRLNACQVLSNAPRCVRWRDGAYVYLYRVKLIIERYSSHAAFRNVSAPLACGYVAVQPFD